MRSCRSWKENGVSISDDDDRVSPRFAQNRRAARTPEHFRGSPCIPRDSTYVITGRQS